MSKSGNKLGRLPLLIAGALVVTVLFTIALERFLAGPGSGASWPAAISAVSSFVLVVVTAVYVALTKSAVQLQGEAIENMRRQESASAVRRVMDGLYPSMSTVLRIKNMFPKMEEIPPSYETFKIPYDQLIEIKNELRSIAPQLPHELGWKTMRMSTLVSDAVIACQALTIYLLKLDSEVLNLDLEVAATSGEETATNARTWDRIRALFYEDEDTRVQLSAIEGKLPEWSDLRDGKYLEIAYAELSKLEDDCRDWLTSSR